MFMFTEIHYRLSRAPGRSLILLLAAVMLVVSMGAYLGNLQTNQAALDNLAENIPVTARVVNRSGTQVSRLSIDTEHFDALTSMDVHGVLCTASAAGVWSDEAQAQDPFAGGDASVTGANCFDALPTVSEDSLTMLDGYSPGFLSGEEPVCGISEAYAQQIGARLGDELSLPLYTGRSSPTGRQTLLVAAVYPYTEINGERSPDIAVPVNWLKGAVEDSGNPFY